MLSFLGAQLPAFLRPGQVLIPCRLENGTLIQVGSPLTGASGIARLPPARGRAAPMPLGPERQLQAGLAGPFMIGGRVIESIVTVDPINGEIAFLFTYISEEKNAFDHKVFLSLFSITKSFFSWFFICTRRTIGKRSSGLYQGSYGGKVADSNWWTWACSRY